MVEIVGLEKVVGGLKNLQKQIRFAEMVALTRTASAVKKAEVQEMERVFDRPTPYTLKSLFQVNASKDRLEARVGFKEFAGKGTSAKKYLRAEIFGGARRATRFELSLRSAAVTTMEQTRLGEGQYAIPASGAVLDAYGNVRRGLITQVLSRLRATSDTTQHRSGSRRSKKKQRRIDYFVGRPGGGKLPFGIYQRTPDGIKPVFLFVRQPRYIIRFPFYDVGEKTVEATYQSTFDAEVRRAIVSAGLK